MADIYDVVIIGGGPAGLAAALYASRGLHSTLIVEKGMVGGQITHTERVEDYPGMPDGIGGAELGKAMWDQVTRFWDEDHHRGSALYRGAGRTQDRAHYRG